MMSSRFLTAFCGFAALTLPSGEAHAASRPNVVLIVADDLGFELGCYGHKVVKTPHIDRLAATGTRFLRAHCTTASCSASRSVLLTGLHNHAIGHYGHAHGDNHFSTYESVRTLPVLLAEAGYRTCSIGKYHVAPDYVYRFESYRNEGTQGHRNSVRMAANAKEWIAEKDDRPFFLYFCSADPHRGGGPGGFANFNDDPERYPGVTPVRYQPEEATVPPWLPDTPESRAELAEFYQAISRLDAGVGDLMRALQETGHENDTLVVFLSDNGPPFPGAKTTLYEPGANLPLIVRLPGHKKAGIVSDALVSWADIAPTILDVCGVEPKPGPPVRPAENTGRPAVAGKSEPIRFHGRSFLSAVEREKAPEFNRIFASHTFHEITMYYPMRSVIDGRHKYVFNVAHALPYPFASDLYASSTWQATLKRKDSHYGLRSIDAYVHRPRHELYDLQEDPHELRNLATDPEHRELLKTLQDAVRAFQKDTRDPWVSKWEYE